MLYNIMYLSLCVICALLIAKVHQNVLNIAIQDLISKCTKPRKIGVCLTLLDKIFQISECSSPVCRTKSKPRKHGVCEVFSCPKSRFGLYFGPYWGKTLSGDCADERSPEFCLGVSLLLFFSMISAIIMLSVVDFAGGR